MSLVPSGWLATKLQEIVKLRTGPFGSSLHKSDYVENGIPVINPMHIIDGEIRATLKHCVSKETAESLHEFKLRIGDVVLGRRGEMGRCAVVKEKQSGWLCGTGSLVVTGAKGISPSFLRWMLSSDDVTRRLTTESVGSTMVNLNQQILLDLDVVVPPTVEQTRIVEKLEELFSDLDAGVAELKAAQAKLVRYRQSLLKAAVEGALTAEWRAARTGVHPPPRAGEGWGGGAAPPSQPSPARGGRGQSDSGAQLLQRILTERRARWEAKQLAKFAEQGKAPPNDWQKKYPEPVQPDIGDLPQLPEGWVWASGEQLCEFITKGTTPPKDQDTSKDRPIPFLRVTNLTGHGELDLADKVFVTEKTHRVFLARSAVYPNDVLMNIVGPPLGQVALVPRTFEEWNINQAIAIFRAVDGVSPVFVCRYLLSPIAQQWLKARSKTTAGQTNLTLEVCRSLPFPLPPQKEQEALLTKINAAVDATARQADAIALGLKQSTAQRKNILRAAFSGQLVPQDPNDEPASALLARIRAQREAGERAPTLKRGRKPKGAA